jgi:hypothetical protein
MIAAVFESCFLLTLALRTANLQPYESFGSDVKTKALNAMLPITFGTSPIDARAIINLTGVHDEPPLLIPSGPVNMAYTAPECRLPTTDRTAQVVNIPAIRID